MVNRIHINTKKVLFPVAEDLYGLFFEDINRAGDGGLYPEMIRNRSFEDSLTPAGCQVDDDELIYVNRGGWPGAFNHGEGMDDWAAAVPYTPIPGWYCEKARINLDANDTLNDKRESSLRVVFEPDGIVWNIGYAGVPIKKEATYIFYAFLKINKTCNLSVSLESEDGTLYAESLIKVTPHDDWQRIDSELTANGDEVQGRIVIRAEESCEVLFGFTSLMPKETYKGHGLRIDLVEMLRDSHSKFLRFPGGCIVEGLTQETAMRFVNTIGPVWERPSHNLMWHYRTTNGLGFHEYLQLCEDLEIEPMYVCNCGISCQARVGEYFDDKVVDEFIEDALHALEYALGSTDTFYGAMRANAGHPEPFSMKYMEIGNENWGKEYSERYEKFYKVLKKEYPDVIFISNAHTETDGLPTEYVDEHFYNTPEYFLENENRFDVYDRKGPFIFLGEYAVNGGNTISSMECALAEAAFLVGAERNQDIVKLTAYAPLFQNVNYTDWKPNLIVFDNQDVYGIPSYHMIAMMAKNRGKEVIQTELTTEQKPPVYKGFPGILCEKPGLQFRNVKINGEKAEISRTIYGDYEEKEGIYAMQQNGKPHKFTGKSEVWNKAFGEFIQSRRFFGAPKEDDLMWVTFGNEDLEEYTFEVEMKFNKDNPVTLSIWNNHPNTDVGCNEPKDQEWNLHNVKNQIWKIKEGKGVTKVLSMFEQNLPKPEETELDIDYSSYNTYKIVANHYGYKCYINEKLVQEKVHILHPVIYSVSTKNENEVILKLVHVGNKVTDVEISFDSEVLPDIEIEVLTGRPDEVNSMEQKTNIAPKKSSLVCDGYSAVYHVPEYSVSILKATLKDNKSQ